MNNTEVLRVGDRLVRDLRKRAGKYSDFELDKYYRGESSLDFIGLSVPENLRALETVINWPSEVVEAIAERSEVRTLINRESDSADAFANRVFEANAMDQQVAMFTRDKLIFGRAFFLVGASKDSDIPAVSVASPLDMRVEVDPVSREIVAAVKIYRGGEPSSVEDASYSLYLPDATYQVHTVNGRREIADADYHGLGRVPIVMGLNRQLTGDWNGISEMANIIPVADMASRALTGMQLALETVAIPRRYAIGLSPDDFVGRDGKPTTKWESYMSEIWSTVNTAAKIGQLPGADLSNYHATLQMYGRLASSVTGFPASYFGNFSANPAAEGAIRAEEARLVKTVERNNLEVGKAISWVVDIATKIVNPLDEWPTGNGVRVEWVDPGTPTYSQRADALQKLAGGVAVISREDAQDELGWNEARKARSRQYFEEQELSGIGGRMLAKYGEFPESAEESSSSLP